SSAKIWVLSIQTNKITIVTEIATTTEMHPRSSRLKKYFSIRFSFPPVWQSGKRLAFHSAYAVYKDASALSPRLTTYPSAGSYGRRRRAGAPRCSTGDHRGRNRRCQGRPYHS